MPPSVENNQSHLETPELIDELAELCREYVFRAVGCALDDTPDTLPVVDEYLSRARESILERPELGPLVVRAAGAYFGRVLSDAIDGFWLGVGPDVALWRVCSRTAFLAVNPAGVVQEALGGSRDSPSMSGQLILAPGDEPVVAKRLDALPPVPEEEYNLLSTRLEAIVVAHDALVLDQNVSGLDEFSYQPSDYESDE